MSRNEVNEEMNKQAKMSIAREILAKMRKQFNGRCPICGSANLVELKGFGWIRCKSCNRDFTIIYQLKNGKVTEDVHVFSWNKLDEKKFGEPRWIPLKEFMQVIEESQPLIFY